MQIKKTLQINTAVKCSINGQKYVLMTHEISRGRSNTTIRGNIQSP